jgi:toxin ParE1/3/4
MPTRSAQRPKRDALPMVRRALADHDVSIALEHYLAQSKRSATDFVNALERAFLHIQRHPATGSPRWAHELNIPGLRSWRCGRYPYLVFYGVASEQANSVIEVWRVLHERQDIPAWMGLDSAPAPDQITRP